MIIQLRSLSGSKSESNISGQHETAQDRNKRVIKTCFILFAVFIVTLFIPVVHLIAPPLCIILGIGFVVKNLHYTQFRVVGTGKCPECAKEFPISELTTKFPIKTFCPHCRNQIYIENK